MTEYRNPFSESPKIVNEICGTNDKQSTPDEIITQNKLYILECFNHVDKFRYRIAIILFNTFVRKIIKYITYTQRQLNMKQMYEIINCVHV